MSFIEHVDWLKEHPLSSDKPISIIDTSTYTLKKTVIFSRHNIRAPFNTGELSYSNVTNRKWINWTSTNGELSMLGGVLEVQMGQYFKKYLEQQQLIVLNEVPKDNQVRVYANSIQRTVATANFFITSVFPVSHIPVEHKHAIGKDDDVFGMRLPFVTAAIQRKINNDLHHFSSTGNVNTILHDYREAFHLLEKISHFSQSNYAKAYTMNTLNLDDLNIIVKQNEMTEIEGALKIGVNASDALVLQYYEESNVLGYSFGPMLDFKQWRHISQVKDLYCDLAFTTPTMAKILAKPLVEQLLLELQNNHRKLSVLVGHDINIGAILSAIDAYDYTLPYSIEHRTPIGSKIVIEKWENNEGIAYANVQLVYFSLKQLCTASVLTLDNPPMRFDLTIKGLFKNKDGLYLYDDVVNCFNNVIDEVTQWEQL